MATDVLPSISSNGFFFQQQTSMLSERRPSPLKTPVPARSSPQAESGTTTDAHLKQHNHSASSGPKQVKSRSGCMTCKKKRIKCDEAKPTCGQCQRRNVECDGYMMNYKWRPGHDTNRPPPKATKPKHKHNTSAPRAASSPSGCEQTLGQPSPSFLQGDLAWSPDLQSACSCPSPEINEALLQAAEDDAINSPEQFSPSQLDLLSDLESGFCDSNTDLLSVLPVSPSHSSGSYDKEFDNETICNWMVSFAPETYNHRARVRAPSPANSHHSAISSQPTQVSPFPGVYLDHASPEMLLLRFDRETCGILSIKDAFAENPWRTFIRPLARTSDALLHANLAMAALHGAATQPRLRLTGMTHMTKSISILSTEMHKMSLNQLLASALALCLSEGWDDKISTGIQHLKGAKTVLNNALAQRSRSIKLGQLSREEAQLLKFLSNTYVYLDAIARLTSSDYHDHIDLDNTVQAVNEPCDNEIDPLMGCATTLFPLLGKVASLIQRIRTMPSNSLSIISEANELREQLLHWEPPDLYSFEQPQDVSCNVRHVLQTAEAYRRAILLHLHSAVTELSSEPSYDQAKCTLTALAGTPVSSRTMIVQIFPLLVGSCEMVEPDDRLWVAQRWDEMMKRLSLVSVSSCWKVVQEVWRRRDQWVETQLQQMRPKIGRSISSDRYVSRAENRSVSEADPFSEDALAGSFQECRSVARNCAIPAHERSTSFDAPCSLARVRNLVQLPRKHTDVSLLSGGMEYSVRGQLHWLGVMSDWNWEVFL